MSTEITEQKRSLEEPQGKTYKKECPWCWHIVDYLDKHSLPHTIDGDPINCKEFALGIKQCTFDPRVWQIYSMSEETDKIIDEVTDKIMEKYAVETEKTSVKTASGHKHCSSCGAPINPNSNVIHCKECGTEPVEKK